MSGAVDWGHSPQAGLFRGVAEGYLGQPDLGEGLVSPQMGAQACKSIPPSFSHTQLCWSFWEHPDHGLCTQLPRQSPLPCDVLVAAKHHKLAGGEPVLDREECGACRPAFLSEW